MSDFIYNDDNYMGIVSERKIRTKSKQKKYREYDYNDYNYYNYDENYNYNEYDNHNENYNYNEFDDFSDYQYRKQKNKKAAKQKNERNKKQILAYSLFYIFCIFSAFGALNYAVKHAHEFKNVRGAKASLKDVGISKNSKDETDINVDKSDDANYLMLVNKDNPVPDDYVPELMELYNGQQLDVNMYPHLQEMFDAMRNEGLNPEVVSGYRSKEYQLQLLKDKEQELLSQGNVMTEAEAEEEAKKWVAMPGTSEHQLGLAVDINSMIDYNDPDPASTEEMLYQWLAENAHHYGFILRYPMDKTDITGMNYEPWHYRYVGEENAEKMYESGLTLEEYLGM